MDIKQIRHYCLSLPQTSEDFPFDEDALAFRVMDKIFAMISLSNPEWFVLKCHPDLALQLRENHHEIQAAWHMNKKYWNQINIFGTLRQPHHRHDTPQLCGGCGENAEKDKNGIPRNAGSNVHTASLVPYSKKGQASWHRTLV